jgi:farnesyl diphosphate synthase
LTGLSVAPDPLRTYKERIERVLEAHLPSPASPPARLHEAMRYSTLAGGKRIRASLVYAAGEALGAALEALDAPACAVELMHAYSLVHDDLPCMDNDDLRRGKPTCHRAYDEATALLVGDALQALAFQILANDPALRVESAARLEMIRTLAEAAGSRGMAGGQAIDLASVGKTLAYDQLEDMHRRKTGALIEAAVRLGALAANGSAAQLDALGGFAHAIGLAFQVVDDILDVEGETATLGKSAGKDQTRNKPTYPALLGLEGARRKARELRDAALQSLRALGDPAVNPAASALQELATRIIERQR